MLDIKLIRENPEKINELLKEEILTYQLIQLLQLMQIEEKFRHRLMNSEQKENLNHRKLV